MRMHILCSLAECFVAEFAKPPQITYNEKTSPKPVVSAPRFGDEVGTSMLGIGLVEVAAQIRVDLER